MSSSVRRVSRPLLAWLLAVFAAAPAAAEPEEPSEPTPPTPTQEPKDNEPAPDSASETTSPAEEGSSEAPLITKTSCIDDHMRGQEARLDDDMSEARRLFQRCADPACPSLVRADCQVWGMEVLDSLPKIVFQLGTGVNPSDVRVLANGEPVSLQFGVPVVFEPGPTELEIEVVGQPPRFERLELALDQPQQTINIALPAPEPTPPEPAAPIPPTLAPLPPPEAPKPAGVPTASYVLGGIAVGGAAVGTFFAVNGLDRRSQASERCSPLCDEDQVDDVRRQFIAADVAFGLSLASAVTAVVVYFSNQPREESETSSELQLDVASEGLSVGWGGQF